MQTLLRRMHAQTVHRVFVLDAEKRPVDCVSQTDVLQFVLRGMGVAPVW
jgi:CBS-domain-containing membrane protein